jgi:biotin transport system ATP-binding protein
LRHNAAEGLTQIVSVHDVEPLADMADTMAVLHKGRLALDGAPEAVLEHAEAYGLRVPCSWRTNRTIAPWA